MARHSVIAILITLAIGAKVQAAEESSARLRVTQFQTACCYMEGQLSYVQLEATNGEYVVDRQFRTHDMIYPAMDEHVPAGLYKLRSFQRPLGGNLGELDHRRDECEVTVELDPQSEMFVTVSFAPGQGCTMTRTDGPVASPVPDRFVFREVLAPCGEYLPSPVTRPDPALECFHEAYQNGARAEVAIWTNVSEHAFRPSFHRILPDGGIEVFVAPENPRFGDIWTYYRCAGLNPVADSRVFTIEACSEPEPFAQ